MFEKIIRDPIHQFITFKNPDVYNILKTKEFQRLMNISQSYSVRYAYPGSTHSRFLHCLGTYEIARRITENHYSEFSEYERLLVQVAALLHDVGHGPLSHTFEMFTKTSHEEYGIQIINSNRTELFQILKKIDKRLPDDIAKVLRKEYSNNSVNQIVSSQIDADRMDYLLRDGHFSGVSYSVFDLELMLKSLSFFEKGKKRIMGFDIGCTHVLEKYLLGRMYLYKQVVLHPKSVGFEIMIWKIIKRARALYKENFSFSSDITLLLPILRERDFTVEEYTQLNDFNFMSSIFNLGKENDNILSDLVYKVSTARLFNYSRKTTIQERENIKKSVISQGLDPDYYFHYFSSRNIAYKSIGNITEQNIYIKNYDSTYQIIDKISPLLKDLGKTEQKITYIFYG